MNELNLLKICHIQTIDNLLVQKGIKRSHIYRKIINPYFFITNSTYYRYLGVNAKNILEDQFSVNWKEKINNTKDYYLKIIYNEFGLQN